MLRMLLSHEKERQIKALFVVFWLALFLFLFLSQKSFSLELIYPDDGTYVTRSNYLIVKGGTDPLLDGLAIEINGVKSDIIDISGQDYREIFGDTLKVEPIFDPGENRIIVEGYVGKEKFDTVRATIFYQDSPDHIVPDKFTRERFHLPLREEPCQGCHNMTPTAAELNHPAPQVNPCASCHKRMLNKDHVHGPAGVYECTYCHETDSQPVKYRPKNTNAALCFECHDGIQEKTAESKFIHGPVEVGDCLICHDPHATDVRSQLLAEVNSLCLSCHEKVSGSKHVAAGTSGRSHPLEGPVNPMNQSKAFDCTSCHNPHAGMNTSYFIDNLTGRMQLCAKCHKK